MASSAIAYITTIKNKKNINQEHHPQHHTSEATHTNNIVVAEY
ncbi:hypothetical protein PPL_05568 [Heterostelium album PN500]|uniref:Uncharacterized protein n=1 Tax=Heterostelium pallidum (strain ATCC 26659 / Pp 5 / PN500) TaxID=670386 RepID=D3BAJ0_HETP5|nr:hypothetical protein PPL_05568 [Heterostelium album PN500]EFA81577.1 hypothetical protein PPL_05568 [Heterostelium album PN500]|eukprot:XP_020433694.1 hypothetical protein PPL_05568 [Heterostelium album PN500]